MPSILERLRAALGGEYDVERELASGGMGVVFLARERSLDRLVAIKVLRPEWATAVAAERFLREARTLAGLNHLAIVPIHRVGEADGLPYFVMEYLDGGTLADRLRNGPLKRREVFHLGLGLLGALDKAHRNRVLHRDIKPANVFYREDQPVLGDFGIAKGASDESLTGSGYAAGTPGYMAPEQLTGQPATAATDVYGFGMLLYEAATGCRWLGVPGLADPDKWTGVPRRLARVLQRALRPDPADRWKDAGAFRTALLRAKARRNPVFIAAGVVSVGVAVFLLAPRRPPPDFTDLAILPLEVVGGPDDQELGMALAQMIALHLDASTSKTTVSITPMPLSALWWESSADHSVPAALLQLRARHVALGEVVREGNAITVQIDVIDSGGEVRPTERISGTYDGLADLGFAIGHALVRVVAPQKAVLYTGQPALLGRSAAAVQALIDGIVAFQREMWSLAEDRFDQALELDPTFPLAEWHRFNVRRWRRLPLDIDHLADIYARYPDDFNDLDRLLIEADLATSTTEKLEKYRAAIEQAPLDAYPWLLYGNELFSRGALVGIELDSAIAVLDSAVSRNPFLAPAQSTLTWALIRSGQTDRATAVLEQYRQVSAPETDVGFCFVCVLDLLLAQRLGEDVTDIIRREWLSSAKRTAVLSGQLRFALSFGIPRGQYIVGGLLTAVPNDAIRGSALLAQGLGLVALGRMHAALAHFDSAARLLQKPEYALHAAQWRIIPAIVGMPGASRRSVAGGRATLEAMVADTAVGARAAWTLALDAHAAGTAAAARRWTQRIPENDSAFAPLRGMLAAVAAEAAGDYQAALRHSEPVLQSDVGGRGGDPFLRALLHLKRGQWQRRLDDPAADRSWRWYLNADAGDGWLDGEPQAAEIDWAFESYARHLRGMAAQSSGERERMCRVLPEVVARWRDADPSFAALVQEANTAVGVCS